MGSAVYFFAAPEDTEALTRYAESLGLVVVSMRLSDAEIEASRSRPQDHPICYLSPVPIASLHPYGKPAVNISSATDPLLEYWRSRVVDGTLVQGRIYWSDDVEELARASKPFFDKVRRWIQKSWRRREEDGYYVGPVAANGVERGKYRVAYLDPNASMVRTEIADSGKPN